MADKKKNMKINGRTICVGCESPFLPGETVHYSGLYGATDEHTLCTPCSQTEDHLCENTNDQPQLLQGYNDTLNKRQEIINRLYG